MKILYVYDQLPSTYQNYMANLLETAKKEVEIHTLAYNDARADHNIVSFGIKDRLQRLASKLSLSKNQSLDIKIMKEYDIIHLQHSYLFKKLQPLFKNEDSLPKIVITLRGNDTYIKPWLNSIWQDFYKINSKYITSFITVSKHQKEYLQKWGVEKNKIHVIPVSLGEKTNAKPKQISSKKIQIVSAHRMCWEKNIEGNIRVIKILKEKGYDVTYHIYGDGPDRGQIPYFIDKYNLQNEITYLGKVENNVFKEKLSNYDFFLQLSHSEAFGASVIEAQSMGVPAIISNSDGLLEAIIDNETGFAVDSYDIPAASLAIEKLFLNKEKYFQFSQKSIENSHSKFSIDVEINKLQNLYKKIL